MIVKTKELKMSAWGEGILENDVCADALFELSEIIGYRAHKLGLATIDWKNITEDQTNNIKELLLKNKSKILKHKSFWGNAIWLGISFVYVKSDTEIPDSIKTQALSYVNKEINNIENYGWQKPSKRVKILKKYLKDLEKCKSCL